jgi:hypothetical protein
MNILLVIISTAPFGSNQLHAYRAAENLPEIGHRMN